MLKSTSEYYLLAISRAMRMWLIAVLGAFVYAPSLAQVRIMPAPVNDRVQEISMYDDGCGIAI